ncbi:unnamed protein product [Vitrella brassicaformis CCMP3155]|uniref:26S proteasome regulatory subunit RPN2 C-terminal domain-containing protein n=1 Tax=Vitrella brassicaformis (strain CCMP3155) TaxID=1169540 RepID=A0A0G4EHX2_VITBC|nr:unnamed protein product [Vitrella brassicaformis CCMP3155]|eukprot:CEL95825.1 unnamed protein product [Vitrella brassicaformis CCMP3155]
MSAACKVERPRQVSSAAGVLSLLDEQEYSLRVLALQKLNSVVDQFWAEIADYLADIESLYEDPKFDHRELAALVASKVYYHLEEYDDALRLALGAGNLFVLSEKSQYVHTIISRCIDEYVSERVKHDEAKAKEEEAAARQGAQHEGGAAPMDVDQQPQAALKPIDSRLEAIVERMFDQCVEDREYRQALGIALEARRLDRVEGIIKAAPNTSDILRYCLRHAQTVILSKRFRTHVLELLVRVYREFPPVELEGELANLCQCLFFLNDVTAVANILKDLVDKQDQKHTAMAYQIAFDIANNEDQQFLKDLLSHLPAPKVPEPPQQAAAEPAAPAEGAEVAPAAAETGAGEPTATTAAQGEGGSTEAAGAAVTASSGEAPAADQTQADAEVLPAASGEGAAEAVAETTQEETPEDKKLRLLRYILDGDAAIDLHLLFLSQKCKADLQLLEHIKNSVDQRNSISHNGIVIAHSIMHAGTTEDEFLRKNLDWLAKAVSWAKFTATASLGVIHKGHFKNSMKVLEPYLPQTAPQPGGYSEGGALYALGLIHANHSNPTVRQYLMQQLLASSQNEQIQHGACLGLGLLCMGSHDEELYEKLKEVLFTDSAIAGEAAGYAMGLVMLGSTSEHAISELLAYAHDTQHEKIIRACALSLALIMFKREEEAETLIQQLMMDKDPILRYGAMFTIAMAYCGSYSNTAIRRLLHVSVSDVSDDVRRAAVIALGFILCNVPEQVPKVVNLLCQSYNPHVRYASCIALGIACAGTAMSEAVNLLIPMASDTTDFVRQGALLALGLVLQQATDALNEKTKDVRELFIKVLADKHEDIMTRFGAILAYGLIDAGGRNAAVSFYSKAGSLRSEAAVGMCLFCQLWYWFPLIHTVALAFQPTGLIGLTTDLKMPSSFAVKNTAKPEMFAYPAQFQVKKDDAPTKTTTAVLSTTVKQQLKKRQSTMHIDDKEGDSPTAAAAAPPPPPSVAVKEAETDEGSKTATAPAPLRGAGQQGGEEDSASILSDMPSTRGADVASTAATIGEYLETSHTEVESTTSIDARSMAARSERKEDVTMTPADAPAAAAAAAGTDDEKDKKKEGDGGGDDPNKAAAPTEEEKDGVLKNPCRVLPRQEAYIDMLPDNRYKPIISDRKSGFLILLDQTPDEPEEYVQPKAAKEEDKEPEPPEAFEWSG